jgi:hypothetical protein
MSANKPASKLYLFDPPKKSPENKAPHVPNQEAYYRDHRGRYVLLNGIPLTNKQVQDLGSDFGKRLRELRLGLNDTPLGRKLKETRNP